jgi:hypothetical protein
LQSLVAAQVPVAGWHARSPDPTMDRLVHHACRLAFSGKSWRKVDSALPIPTT